MIEETLPIRPRRFRCYCGHPFETHLHYRPGTDCGECGTSWCHRYVGRDEPMPETHTRVAAVNDAHMWRNLWALSELTRPVGGLRGAVPAQRVGPGRPLAQLMQDRRAAEARRRNR